MHLPPAARDALVTGRWDGLGLLLDDFDDGALGRGGVALPAPVQGVIGARVASRLRSSRLSDSVAAFETRYLTAAATLMTTPPSVVNVKATESPGFNGVFRSFKRMRSAPGFSSVRP